MAATTASTPIYDALAESPLDQDDVLYPCKGCGEILEEGKAFELAGNRWHIDCFRCNTCGTLLDSDANLLLLGDGSLICNNCTYSCNACGNKIEDLAILTGDQAFCASCFRCRNCKRKIENLRYARTSQGIFCMSCHEALMARRRKKSRTGKTTSTQSIPSSAPAVLDKSLPALPSTADITPDSFSHPDSFSRATNDQSTLVPPGLSKNAYNVRHEASPSTLVDKENLTLPSSTYSNDRLSNASSRAEAVGDDDFFIPVALDPSPGPHSMPTGQATSIDDATNAEPRATSRDYFVGPRQSSAASSNDQYRDMISGSSRSASADRSGQKIRSSPHIAYQEKGRQHSSDVLDALRKRQETGTEGNQMESHPSTVHGDLDMPVGQTLPTHPERNESAQKEPFRLQDAPKWRGSSGSKRSSDNQASTSTNLAKQPGDASQPEVSGSDNALTFQFETLQQGSLMSGPPSSLKGSPVPSVPFSGTPQLDRPKREDSLKSPPVKQAISRKEVPRSAENENENSGGSNSPIQFQERQPPLSSPLMRPDASQPSARILDASPPIEAFDPQTFMNSGRTIPPILPEVDETFVDPRDAPPPPPQSQHQHSLSTSSFQGDQLPSTPVRSSNAVGEFSIDSESSRNLKAEEGDGHGSVFRRVSNAVKHGRSLSDRGAHGASSPKWSKSARNGSIDISSPIMASPDSKDDAVQLRNRLRFSQQRVAELEAEKHNLLEQVNGTVEIKQVNTELREKRSTMAFLDTQKEMVVRELEVLTDHLQYAKETDDPVNIKKLKTEILKDFANSLQKLKDGLGTEIEDLMHQKNQLTAEISNLIQMKDKGFQEFENLTTKNTQLAELNNQLVHSIQELYKQGRQTNGVPVPGISSNNGLGIYNNKERSDIPVDYRSVISHDGTVSQLSGDTEVEPATVLTAPQVVNIRKGQPKKFNWKKGGHAVAKNVTKGFKGAFGGGLQNAGGREDGFDAGLPYGSMSSGPLPTAGGPDPNKQGWSFLTQKVGTSRPGQASRDLKDNSSASLPSEALFGSELEARAEFEKRVIPHVVTACIAEVETRGMSSEGIYRKSGSTSLVNTIKLGFENSSDYDISDPDLDIHAVTSALKQYFRKLPTPLITYDCYDGLLEAAAEEDEEARAENIREAVESLPRAHKDCLEFLVFHLVRVMEKESQNLMTPHNLAVIFAPTIMRPVSIEREMSDMQAQRTVVLSLIQQNKIIFGSQE